MSNGYTLQVKLKQSLREDLDAVAESKGLTKSEIARRGIINEVDELR